MAGKICSEKRGLHSHPATRELGGETIKISSIVRVHMLCASRIAYTSAGVGIGVINYATRYVTKMKAKFFFVDQIKFNEPVLKQGTPQWQHLLPLTVNGFQLKI